MKRTTGFGSYDAYPKTIMAQTDVYNNMSHHYRRLYSAKPCIDTGLKQIRKGLPHQKERKCSADWTSCRNRPAFQRKVNKCCPNQIDLISNTLGNKHEMKQKDVLDGIDLIPFHPRILRTDVESKLRSLSVYHPPRKKVSATSMSVNARKARISDEDDDREDYNWPRENTSNASKLSSSDSAYTEEGDGMWSGGESRGETPQSRNSCWSMNVRSDNACISFLRAITDEVLRKGIFTNKALKQVFRDHINKNRHRLDIKIMEEEVEKLQLELGIPKDDDLNEIDFGLGSMKPQWYESSKSSKGSGTNKEEPTDVLDSFDQLNLSPLQDEVQLEKDWYKKGKSPLSENLDQPEEENVKMLLKAPIKDYDNDSSIGCEILSECSESGGDRSV